MTILLQDRSVPDAGGIALADVIGVEGGRY